MTLLNRIVVGLFVLTAVGVQAQTKIAHLNQAELLNAMPETKTIEDSLNMVANAFDNEFKLMLADVQQLEGEINNNPNMLTTVKKSKQDLVVQLKINAQQFQYDAQQELSDLQDSLLAPLVAKIKKAIDEVCVEKGYNYVFDTSLGNPIFTDPKHDILGDVKKKLGLL